MTICVQYLNSLRKKKKKINELLPLHNVQYEKNTDLSGRPIRKKMRLPVVQYGKNNVRSHILNGCF